MRILLVESDASLSDTILRPLLKKSFVIDVVSTLATAHTAVKAARFSLVVIDRHLSDGDGLALVEIIKARPSAPPILLVTAANTSVAIVCGLNAGADDCIAKPFDREEFIARVRALLRRPAAQSADPIEIGQLIFHPADRVFEVRGQALTLPRRELALLEALVTRARRVVLRAVLINDIFNFDDEIQSNTLDSHVSRLRARLLEADAGVVINPVRGVGYVIQNTPR
jgi:DNA-binding response OmpR family regulator